MRGLINSLNAFFHVNWFKTFFYNLYLLPFKQAVVLPIVFDNFLVVKQLYRGGVIIDTQHVTFGMIRLGRQDIPTQDRRKKRMVIFVEKGSKIVFKGKAIIGGGTQLLLRNRSELVFGNDFYLSFESSIYCYKGIEFGSNCTIGWNVLIMDTDWHKTVDINSRKPFPTKERIDIGNHCWICNDVQIQKGTTIPDNVIVAAKSLCNKKYEVPEHSLLAGVPAKLKKEGIDYVR